MYLPFRDANDFCNNHLVTRDVTFAQLLCSNLPASCHMGANLAVPPAPAAAGRLTTNYHRAETDTLLGLLTLWFVWFNLHGLL